ncbi:hypothetical protein BGZ65_009976 [Modicella reniformis]|uniref:Uncharacterized protein n=1 Tax=Modicella reniformis TaxID=1440133 RepID=A0A9P6LVA2_9FUNG|nr:hypothetical protein BGZ65_009976 [Modicella reniformis]
MVKKQPNSFDTHRRQVIPEEEGTLETHAEENDEADDDNRDNDDNNHDSDDNYDNYDDNPTEDYATAEDCRGLYQTPNTKLPRATLPNMKLPRLTIRARRILLEGRQMRMPAKT